MKKTIFIILFLFLVFFFIFHFSLTAVPDEDDEFGVESLVKKIPPDEINLNGEWTFNTHNVATKGQCPAGKPLSGKAVFIQKEKAITFQYTKGAKCRPPGVCLFSGALDKNNVVVSNSVKVDSEGGTVSGAISLVVYSNKLVMGKGTSNYVHPEGFECRWDMEIILKKVEKEK